MMNEGIEHPARASPDSIVFVFEPAVQYLAQGSPNPLCKPAGKARVSSTDFIKKLIRHSRLTVPIVLGRETGDSHGE
jgi:hypothetical protein